MDTKDVWVFIRSGSFRAEWEVEGVYDTTRTPEQIRPEYDWSTKNSDEWYAHDSDSAEYERSYLSDVYAIRRRSMFDPTAPARHDWRLLLARRLERFGMRFGYTGPWGPFAYVAAWLRRWEAHT